MCCLIFYICILVKKNFKINFMKFLKPFPEVVVNNVDVKYCPHCGSKWFIKFGKYRNVNRYRCKNCMHTFIPTSGTAIHYVNKKDIFLEYIKIVDKNGVLPLRVMCEKLGISMLTAFDWRHKIFLSLSIDNSKFNNLLHNDLIEFNFNEKGRRGSLDYNNKTFIYNSKYNAVNIFSPYDNSRLFLNLVRIGKSSFDDFKRILANQMNKGTIIYTYLTEFNNKEKNLSISKIIDYSKLKHNELKDDIRKLINNHFRYIDDFKRLINKYMRGVATKYLQVYASYYSKTINNFPTLKEILVNKDTWMKFIKLEDIYLNMLNKYSFIVTTNLIKRKWKTKYQKFIPEFNCLM